MSVITGRLVREDESIWSDGAAPGLFSFAVNQGGQVCDLLFICPCGCGVRSHVTFAAGTTPGPVWTWDGNREKPTVTPSIRKLTGCQWHGWLRAGVWVTA